MMYHTNQTMHIHSISLSTKDLKRSLFFYRDILGFTVNHLSHNIVALSTDQGDTLIELIEDQHLKPIGITQGLYHFAILLPSRNDLALVVQRLILKRYPISGASDHGVSEAIYLNDPDGHGVEIYFDRHPDKWPVEQGRLIMYTHALDIDDLMKEIDSSIPYLLPSQTIIGHLHFHVPHLDEAKSFFVDLLGFDITMYYGNSALFIADGGYHHHIGLNTWHKNAPLNNHDQIGLVSYQLDIPRKAFESLIERLNKANYPVLNQHGMLSIKYSLGHIIYLRKT